MTTKMNSVLALRFNVCVVVLQMLCLMCDGEEIENHVSDFSKVTLREYARGRLKQSFDITREAAQDKALFVEIDAWMSSVSEGRPSKVSYAPSVVFETELLQLNLASRMTVISTRDSPKGVWRQISREPTEADRKLRAAVQARMLLKNE